MNVSVLHNNQVVASNDPDWNAYTDKTLDPNSTLECFPEMVFNATSHAPTAAKTLRHLLWVNKVRVVNDSLYLYDEQRGMFQKLPAKQEWVYLSRFFHPRIHQVTGTGTIHEALQRLRSTLQIQLDFDCLNADTTLVNLENGVLNIEKLTHAVHAQQNKMCVESSKMKLAQWLPHWLDTYVVTQIRQSTRVSYDTFIQGHIIPMLGNVTLARLTAQRIQEFYNHKLEKGRLDGKGGISPKTLRNLHNMLHKSLEQAVRLQLIPVNPCDAVCLPPRQKRDVRYLSVNEQKRLQDAVQDERLGCAVILDLFTGLRLGELLGHSSIVITMDLYTHVTDSVKKEAIEKLKDLL